MNNLVLILKAAQFASYKHREQRRKDIDASPYINHPIAVALTIAEIGGVEDQEVLAAALLHDTLEDTDTTRSELIELFGKTVCEYVEEVTDDKSLPKQTRKLKQIDHAKSLSKGAVLIKLGDKISNVTDITNSPPTDWDLERRKEYLDWAESVVSNCPKTNQLLEDYFNSILKIGRTMLISPKGNDC